MKIVLYRNIYRDYLLWRNLGLDIYDKYKKIIMEKIYKIGRFFNDNLIGEKLKKKIEIWNEII